VDKKNMRYAKTVEKYHMNNPNIKRFRELNKAMKLSPFTGLK